MLYNNKVDGGVDKGESTREPHTHTHPTFYVIHNNIHATLDES